MSTAVVVIDMLRLADSAAQVVPQTADLLARPRRGDAGHLRQAIRMMQRNMSADVKPSADCRLT